MTYELTINCKQDVEAQQWAIDQGELSYLVQQWGVDKIQAELNKHKRPSVNQAALRSILTD